jgi:hypothetical protein
LNNGVNLEVKLERRRRELGELAKLQEDIERDLRDISDRIIIEKGQCGEAVWEFYVQKLDALLS